MNKVTRQQSASPTTQRGAVVLLLLLIIAVSTAAYFLVRELNSTHLQVARDQTNATVLAQAKDAVLGFAMANQKMPGGLPFPDRASGGGYDGNGDCVTNNFNNGHLLGKFPFLNEQGCGTAIRAFDINPTDTTGERLWYAVSKNLVKSAGGNFPVSLPPINTPTLMSNADWLTVSDEFGTLLSNQVAFVLIAPGEVLPGQNRSAVAPSAQNFLDNFMVGATTYSNWKSTIVATPAFITARPVNNSTNHFNDRLLYVTRDEFVNRLVLRIVGEIRLQLDGHHLTHSSFPLAASASYGECTPTVPNTISGYIPIVDADNDCGGPLAGFPAWWLLHKWQDVTHYAYDISTDQATVRFDSCASTFTITWEPSLKRSKMQRNGSC
jgi:hypothetical protein